MQRNFCSNVATCAGENGTLGFRPSFLFFAASFLFVPAKIIIKYLNKYTRNVRLQAFLPLAFLFIIAGTSRKGHITDADRNEWKNKKDNEINIKSISSQ